MVSKRVHVLYVTTWVSSLLLVGAFAGLIWTLFQAGTAHKVAPVLGLNPFLWIGILAFVLILSALVLALYTIVHTHHLLGSAYRINVVLGELVEGKPSRVHLRDGDFFGELAQRINTLAERLPQDPDATPTPAAPPPNDNTSDDNISNDNAPSNDG